MLPPIGFPWWLNIEHPFGTSQATGIVGQPVQAAGYATFDPATGVVTFDLNTGHYKIKDKPKPQIDQAKQQAEHAFESIKPDPEKPAFAGNPVKAVCKDDVSKKKK